MEDSTIVPNVATIAVTEALLAEDGQNQTPACSRPTTVVHIQCVVGLNRQQRYGTKDAAASEPVMAFQYVDSGRSCRNKGVGKTLARTIVDNPHPVLMLTVLNVAEESIAPICTLQIHANDCLMSIRNPAQQLPDYERMYILVLTEREAVVRPLLPIPIWPKHIAWIVYR